jgi:hypothetical protein
MALKCAPLGGSWEGAANTTARGDTKRVSRTSGYLDEWFQKKNRLK